MPIDDQLSFSLGIISLFLHSDDNMFLSFETPFTLAIGSFFVRFDEYLFFIPDFKFF